MAASDSPSSFSLVQCFGRVLSTCQTLPLPLLLLFVVSTFVGVCVLFYTTLCVVAPTPRPPTKSEKSFRCIESDGRVSSPQQLPCWQEEEAYNTRQQAYNSQGKAAQKKGDLSKTHIVIEEPEVFMSVVVPAYNEQDRLGVMLTETVEYLEQEYGTSKPKVLENGHAKPRMDGKTSTSNGHARHTPEDPKGWEILVVSDGSTDKTVETALSFARDLGSKTSGDIRVVSLHKNRGKGGAVTHGMRHVRGKYAVFADADGASRFSDLGKLVQACQKGEDTELRGVAVGSRAHLVGTESVVTRSFLRNFLMHSFHLILRIMTPPATAAIRDTQCGFKLFSRSSLPYIVPYMHCEGWIFDVEMLMLAEQAQIPVVEVPVGWKEVKGSKLNVIWDSLGMAWGLAVLRAAWAFGVYRV
ncbi:dolichyl-phosphate beta-glucosyltransferase [Trapelia coarctata]|nr:dolichyl-phosphate beta-glucosyltransferase [Trapelia coarctata]